MVSGHSWGILFVLFVVLLSFCPGHIMTWAACSKFYSRCCRNERFPGLNVLRDINSCDNVVNMKDIEHFTITLSGEICIPLSGLAFE